MVDSIRFIRTGLAVVANHFSIGTAFASIVAGVEPSSCFHWHQVGCTHFTIDKIVAVSIVIEGPTTSHLSTAEGSHSQGGSTRLVGLPSIAFVAHFAAYLPIVNN